MNRRVLLACAVALATLAPARADDSSRPNFVLIQADDLGYGDLGAYGQNKIRTPNLDRLAAEGLRFTGCYAGSTVCGPSRACLMSGHHTGHNQIRGNARDLTLAAGTQTIARLLDSAGYATACIGKWGLGTTGQPGQANLQGFDHFFGYADHTHAHNYYPDFLWRNSTKIATRNEIDWPDGARHLERGGVARVRIDYSPDLILDEALSWLDSHAAEAFLLYFASTLPHANNEAHDKGMEVPDFGPYAETTWPAPEKGRAAMISLLDAHVGRLVEKINALGINSRTVIIFTSDNGPHREGGSDPNFLDSNGPLRGGKRDLYEGGIRVPMIVRWPSAVTAGTTTDALVAHWDFLPTACELAGLAAPAGIDGRSWAPLLAGGPPPRDPEDHLYWEFFEGTPRQAVRRGQWKAVFWHGESPRAELFNLKSDPAETIDLASRHPSLVNDMRVLATAAHSRSPNPKWNF